MKEEKRGVLLDARDRFADKLYSDAGDKAVAVMERFFELARRELGDAGADRLARLFSKRLEQVTPDQFAQELADMMKEGMDRFRVPEADS